MPKIQSPKFIGTAIELIRLSTIFTHPKQIAIMNLIVYSFKTLSQSEIGNFAYAIIQNMKNDAQFASLKPVVDELQTAYDAFNLALVQAAKGGKDRIEEKNARWADLINSLTTVALSVDLLAKGSEKVILAAGYELRKPRKPTEKLTKPNGFNVINNEESGAINLSWDVVQGAVNYAIEHLAKGETAWQNGKYSTRKEIVVKDFAPGTFVEFRVRALGRHSLESEWTSPVGVWVA